MSAPYGQQYGGQPAPYGDQTYADPSQQQPADIPASPPSATPLAYAAEHGKKKKRTYAADAFNVGTGANVAAGVGVSPPAPGMYGAPAPAAGAHVYGGYGAPTDPQYGAPQQQQQPIGVSAGGYQYPDYGVAAASPGGVDGLTAGVANMGFTPAGSQPPLQQQQPLQVQQQAQQAGAPARSGPLNQLYPTDLLSQPFNVSELELPPPPIILPPNVGPPQTCIDVYDTTANMPP